MTKAGYLGSLLLTAGVAARRRLWPRRPPLDPPRRVLVLGYAAIGDLILFLPVLEGLRRRYKEAAITFLANRYPTTDELLPAARLVDEIWRCDWEGPGAAEVQAAINARIHAARFDLAVLTLSSPLHFFQWGLREVPVLAGHRRREGGDLKRLLITGELARRALLDRAVEIEPGSEHAAARNLRLLEALGVPAPEERPALPSERRADYARQVLKDLPPGRKKVGVHLGPPGGQYHKVWSPERFARLCALMAKTWNAEILLVGAADEKESVERVRRACPGARSWVGKTSLLETFAIIKQCDIFVSCDTGLAKAAMALGVPTATLFGPTDPLELGVYWDKEKHLEIRTGIACSPCVRLGMAKEGVLNFRTCGHHDCLEKLEVESVWDALRAKYS